MHMVAVVGGYRGSCWSTLGGPSVSAFRQMSLQEYFVHPTGGSFLPLKAVFILDRYSLVQNPKHIICCGLLGNSAPKE